MRDRDEGGIKNTKDGYYGHILHVYILFYFYLKIHTKYMFKYLCIHI